MKRTGSIAGNFDLDARFFFGFVIGGMALMVAMKGIALPQTVVTTVMVLLVFSYAFSVIAYPRLHLRLDQAGDNAYYLGLIFTLLSMIYALFEIGQRLAFDTEEAFSEAEAIIGDFGLALATTLAGIVCRLLLHQMRRDPADIEHEARVALATASLNMQQQIKDLSIQLGGFFDELSQRNSDFLDKVTETQSESLARITEANEKSADAIGSRVESIAGDMGEFHAQLRTDTGKLTATLRSSSGKIEEAASAAATSLNSMTEIDGPTREATESITKLAVAIAETAPRLKQMAANISDLSGSVSETQAQSDRNLSRMEESLQRIESAVEERVQGLTTRIDKLSDSTHRLSDIALRANEAVLQSEESAMQVIDGLADALRRAREA